MLYTLSIRNHDDKIVEAVVEGTHVIPMCNLLESAPSVINFKVSNSGSVGIPQNKFGAGDFTKWVGSNF